MLLVAGFLYAKGVIPGTKKDPNAIAPKIVFTALTLSTSNPKNELVQKVGSANLATVLAVNHIDEKKIRKGLVLSIPSAFPVVWQFMPSALAAAAEIPQLVVVSQKVQAFGVYEYGTLIRSGPVSSGKEDTPTTNGLYFVNWKGEEVISTFSDEWKLLWNMNIDNDEGISMHQYSLPGYPASHSCIRMSAADAQWMYGWVQQWILSANGKVVHAKGTPVIVYGEYNFNAVGPWKTLATNPEAITINTNELEVLVGKYNKTIQKELEVRQNLLATE